MNKVLEANYFILIIGRRYGYLYDKTGRAATEEEFNIAYDNNKRILVFIRSEVFHESKTYQRFTGNKELSKEDFEISGLFTANKKCLSLF